MWGQEEEAGDFPVGRTLGVDKAGPLLGREWWLEAVARGQRGAQVRGGRHSRGLQPVGSGGGGSAWLWIGSGVGGWGVLGHGGSLWGKTRVSEGLTLAVLLPFPLP